MKDIIKAKDYLLNNKLSVVIVRDGKVIEESQGRGIKPLFDIYTTRKEILPGSTVADKVIGKAAAMILVNGRIKALYAELISDAAIEVLKDTDIVFEYSKRVSMILNREGNGMCPIEKISSMTEDINKLIYDINSFINK